MKNSRIRYSVKINGANTIYVSMSRTVLGVIKTICKNSNYSENELRLIFPDSITQEVTPEFRKFKTVFIEADKAVPHDFFIKEPIHLKDKVIVITNQWNSSSFNNFTTVVKKQFNIDIIEN